jgi:predicted RNA-binding protein YlxR (DUF448 family)
MSKKKQRRTKHVPYRTCVACRQKYDKRRLTRIVRTKDEGVVIDPSGKRNGRGAYLCDQFDCWKMIEDGAGLLSRALAVDISETEIAAIVTRKPSVDGAA